MRNVDQHREAPMRLKLAVREGDQGGLDFRCEALRDHGQVFAGVPAPNVEHVVQRFAVRGGKLVSGNVGRAGAVGVAGRVVCARHAGLTAR
jgi:hypothetical protein